MFSLADFDPAEIIDIYQNTFSTNCAILPATTFLVYDYLITFHQEVRLFWRHRFTAASALFFYIRYSTLVTYDVLGMIAWGRIPDSSCPMLMKAQAVFSMFQYIPWAAFSALRVLALSGMRWPLAVVVFVLSITPAVINFLQFRYHLTGVNVLTTGCQAQLDITLLQSEIFVATSRSSLILADIIVIIVTVLATRKRGNLPNFGRSSRASLGDVLLHDGVMYFATLTVCNAMHLMLSLISIATPGGDQSSYVTVLSDPLTAILICRFLLDLQAANESSVGLDSEDSLSLAPFPDANGTLRFASRVLGSLGAVPSLSLRSADTSRDCDLGESDPDTVRIMATQRDSGSAFLVADASTGPPNCDGRD